MSSDGRIQFKRPTIVFPILSISWHGGTRVLIQVANYLAGLGYPVTFLVARNRCETPFEFADGVEVKQLGLYSGFKTLDYLVFLCCVPFNVGANSILIASFFVTYYPVRLLALMRKLPYLYFVQDIESKYSPPYGLLLNKLCNWTYRDHHIVAANAYLRDRLKGEFAVNCRSISVGPNDSFYELQNQKPKTYDVIYMLRGEQWKGLDRFLRFLAITKERLTCLCVSQDEDLEKFIAGTSATFVKPRTDKELIECMDSARVLFLTSYREGFALPPLEGMARGLPAVLFRCGGPDQYIVDGGNAFYVRDETHAAEAVESLKNDPTLYARMSEAALITAGEYRMGGSLALMAEFVDQCREQLSMRPKNRHSS